MTWKQWMTAAAGQWNGLAKHRTPRSGDRWSQPPGDSEETGLQDDGSGPRWHARFGAHYAGGREGAVPAGLRTIHDELNSLAETQRLLAILAATAVREGDAQASPWANLAERARLLASRAEYAGEALAGVLQSRTGRDGLE